ncbi:MAG TPA: hypothetical protein VJZ72_05350, partial [Candidatus Limnocylindrales bacterium]|nr:hypothetical protein [Candidatus Limnocylindrales bacterium]
EVKGELPSGYESIFRYSLIDPAADVEVAAGAYRPPFGHLALLAQVPGVDIGARLESEKGSPLTDVEVAILAERLAAARAWLEGYAPDRAIVAVRDSLPAEAAELTDAQRAYLGGLAAAAPATDAPSGEAWQAVIFATAAEQALESRDAFRAIYLAFLGRTSGPRAGWLLASQERGFVLDRLRLKV